MVAKTMDQLVSLCKRRGFIFQNADIYGGMQGVYDYGPLGVELKNNLKAAWWRAMVYERDDIEGLDAGRKVAILASVAFNSRVVFDDVYIEGITKITAKDIKYAKEMGCDIKLLGVAKNTEEGIEAYVCPMLIPSSHPLASVNDSYNAVFVNGDAVENAMFYGRGAGELPTASAVVGDLFDIARNIKANCCARIGCTCYKELPVKKMADTYNRYFMRLIVEDRCGVLAEMTAVFAKYGVSVAQIIQKAARAEESAEVVVITAKVREGDFRTAMEELSGRSSVRKVSSMLRVYGE